MQRTAQITEFNLLKETVKRLERSSREQLLLENESQGAFDHVTAEVGRLKDAVSALSKVVDDELDALRGECLSLRQELQSVFGRSRKETHTAVAAVGEKRKQDVALSAQGLQEVRTALAKLEEEVRQNRGLCQDLTKEVTRLDGGIDGARNTLTKQCEGLASRLGVAEAQSVANKEELSESQRRDRAEVAAAAAAAVAAQQQQQEQQQQQQQQQQQLAMQQLAMQQQQQQQQLELQQQQLQQQQQADHATLSRELSEHKAASGVQASQVASQVAQQAKQAESDTASLRAALADEREARDRSVAELHGQVTTELERSIADVVQAARSQAAELAAKHKASAEAIAAAASENQRHRDAIQLLVESAAAAREEAQRNSATLVERIGGVGLAAEERTQALEGELRDLADVVEGRATVQDVRDAVRQLDGRLRQQESTSPSIASTIAANATRHTERCRALEAELASMKQESAAANAQARAFKTADKALGEQLSAQKQYVKRVIDEIERRHEAYDDAVATFAEALQIPNPVVSAAAAAL